MRKIVGKMGKNIGFQIWVADVIGHNAQLQSAHFASRVLYVEWL